MPGDVGVSKEHGASGELQNAPPKLLDSTHIEVVFEDKGDENYSGEDYRRRAYMELAKHSAAAGRKALSIGRPLDVY